MAHEEFQQISLPVRTDRPWVLCFIPLSLRWIGRLAQTACYYGLLLLLTGAPGVVQPPDSNAPIVVYSTMSGEHKPVTLPDGSKVELNSDSSISVTFSPLARLVELTRGEALFDVNHESTRPFRVKSGRSIIEDIGTAFDVYKKPHSTRILVVAGRIKIYRRVPASSHSGQNDSRARYGATSTPEFHKGQQIELPEDSSGSLRIRSNVSDADLSRQTLWREGRVEYNGEPLPQAAEDFGRYHGVKFTVTDKALRKLRIGGSFLTSSLADFLWGLRHEFNIQSEKSVDTDGSTIITLTPGTPKKASDNRSRRD